jgi:multiple sugar transport system ATP-binding protein
VGIRPEGFLVDEQGPLCCELTGIEVMGRDVSVISRNHASVSPSIRAIIGAENRVDPAGTIVRFSLRPSKVFLFDHTTEVRIPCEVE